jgi:hypothetical protein
MIRVGDLLSGKTQDARGWAYVTGTVIETDDSSMVINGITITDQIRGTFTVRMRDVLTYIHTRAEAGLST